MMCGIWAFIGHPTHSNWQRARAILHHLCAASAVRGPDATAFIAMPATVNARHGPFIVAEEPVHANWFVVSSRDWLTLPPCGAVVGHVGSACHHSVAEQYGLALDTDGDTECLLRLMEQHPHPAMGLSACLRERHGPFAIVVLDRLRQVLWLARTKNRPLTLCQVRDIKGWFVCSSPELMFRALERVADEPHGTIVQTLIPLAPDSITGISTDGRLLTLTGVPITRLRAGLATDLFASP